MLIRIQVLFLRGTWIMGGASSFLTFDPEDYQC